MQSLTLKAGGRRKKGNVSERSGNNVSPIDSSASSKVEIRLNNRVEEFVNRLSKPTNYIELGLTSESDTESLKNLKRQVDYELLLGQNPNDLASVKRKKAGQKLIQMHRQMN